MTKAEAEEIYDLLSDLTDAAWGAYCRIDNMRDEWLYEMEEAVDE